MSDSRRVSDMGSTIYGMLLEPEPEVCASTEGLLWLQAESESHYEDHLDEPPRLNGFPVRHANLPPEVLLQIRTATEIALLVDDRDDDAFSLYRFDREELEERHGDFLKAALNL